MPPPFETDEHECRDGPLPTYMNIQNQVMWNRLLSVVEEQGQTLIRTAFSPIVRECGDISAGVFDLKGRMMAQAVTGTPGYVNSMAEPVKHFLHYFHEVSFESLVITIIETPPITTAAPMKIMGEGSSPRKSILEAIVKTGSNSITGITFET